MLEYLPKTMSILIHTVIYLYISVIGLQLIIAKKFKSVDSQLLSLKHHFLDVKSPSCLLLHAQLLFGFRSYLTENTVYINQMAQF